MPQSKPSPIHEDWWISRQFKEAEFKAKTERLQRQREGAEAIWALTAELGLTDEDLREMFPATPSTSTG